MVVLAGALSDSGDSEGDRGGGANNKAAVTGAACLWICLDRRASVRQISRDSAPVRAGQTA